MEINLHLHKDSPLMSLPNCITLKSTQVKSSQLRINVENSLTRAGNEFQSQFYLLNKHPVLGANKHDNIWTDEHSQVIVKEFKN